MTEETCRKIKSGKTNLDVPLFEYCGFNYIHKYAFVHWEDFINLIKKCIDKEPEDNFELIYAVGPKVYFDNSNTISWKPKYTKFP